MEKQSPSQHLSLVHELTLTILSLFSPEQDLHHVLEDLAERLDLPVLLLWKKYSLKDFELLCSVGLSQVSDDSVRSQLKDPMELLALTLPEFKVLSDHWCFPLHAQSPYFLQLVFPEAPNAVLQNVLQQLGETLHKALHHRDLQTQNIELVNRLQAVLDTSPDGVVFLTDKARVRSANPRAEALLGKALHQDQDFMALLNAQPKLKGMLGRWVTQSSPAGSYWDWDTGSRVLDVRCVPVAMGASFFYTLYIRDVTEAQRTSKKLRETKARLETILAHLQMGIVLESREGQALLINPSLQEMFALAGDAAAETQAQQLHQTIAQNFVQPELYLTALEALRQEKKPFMGKVYACKNGRFVEHDAIPILFDQLLTGHLWVFRDVTEKVLAEAERRRLAQFPEKNPNPVLQINHKGQVLYANTPARYLLSSWHTDLYEYVPRALFTEMLNAKKTGQTLLTNVPFGKRSFQVLVVYFAQEGLYHLYATDISRLQQAEQNALAMRDHAITASAAKSEFLAVMSHEIRTPLNAVLGMLELLHQQVLTPVQTSYVESARGAGENLLALINHILDFSRLESGRLELLSQPFLLAPILAQCISVFRYKAEEKGLELSYTLEPEAEIGFLGDAQRIRQVFFILVDNALKFTAKGHVRVLVSRPEGGIVVAVEDTGVGISASQQDIIFERFRQADSSITREYGGTGLGLSIAQELVSLHGGELSVSSQPGKGSCFRFTLPLEEATLAIVEDETAERSLSPADYRKNWQNHWSRELVLLVVEDAPENRALIEAYLADFPVLLHFAHNGHAGIQAWKKHQPDLVLMDVQMPVLDGLSATRAIYQLCAENEAPLIVALTADASEQASQAALDAGCQQVLTKPLSQKTLLRTLDDIVKGPTFGLHHPEKAVSPVAHVALSAVDGDAETAYRFLPQLAPIYPVFFNSRRQDMERFALIFRSETPDWEVLERSGHSLKGSGASFGFPLLSTLGAALEQAARVKDIDTFKQLCQELSDYIQRVQPEVEALLAELPASSARSG